MQKKDDLLLRALEFIPSFLDAHERNATRLYTVARGLGFISAGLAIYISVTTLLNRNVEVVDASKYYYGYETVILERTEYELTIITQFNSKRLCKKDGDSKGKAVSENYGRFVSGESIYTHKYDDIKPEPKEGWVHLPAYRIKTDGFPPNESFALQFFTSFDCAGKKKIFRFPVINVLPMLDNLK